MGIIKIFLNKPNEWSLEIYKFMSTIAILLYKCLIIIYKFAILLSRERESEGMRSSLFMIRQSIASAVVEICVCLSIKKALLYVN